MPPVTFIPGLKSGIRTASAERLRDIEAVTDAALSRLDERGLLETLLERVKKTLQADTAAVFRRALAFAGQAATDAQIERAVAFARFEELQRQEQDKGFREAPRPHAGGQFFRRGVAGGWRDELGTEQVARIEAAHAPTMQKLGYDLSAPNAAAAGEAA